ncbi:hypothetical protein GCM10023193_17420 [Planotetraspora kaengkrachanensis]|uniref:Uncharacterized protein n=1 Tax=Planotetraspora kaengkrachanensis TaxID=575193 RepID=A0A8J3PTG0_9ACTN|nr:hypothetical protein Pka01_29080 [Planotetraspora kaengkrachanensis]
MFSAPARTCFRSRSAFPNEHTPWDTPLGRDLVGTDPLGWDLGWEHTGLGWDRTPWAGTWVGNTRAWVGNLGVIMHTFVHSRPDHPLTWGDHAQIRETRPDLLVSTS